ncbi:MAG: hypothetical protein JNJ49_12285 [Bdellovibrionaceae bacterium]|nr:hypothetical protein [Pseudobdellovibrionaceae bacterium]
MQPAVAKGLSISIDETVDLNRQLPRVSTATVTLIDSDLAHIEFEVPLALDDLRTFAQRLIMFPRSNDDIVELVWKSGRQKKSGGSIATGQLRLCAKMIDVGGFSELKLEPLEVKTFVPGTKFSIAVGVQPLQLNQLGLSLETWLTRPSALFSFPI